MIIATAGHVDHGKTALIRQLTGVETDRLEEEQRRGLSISLGYAYLPREAGAPIGFIDVPGHQRFINNMISGISGIDLGMLVVAADDGPMPQTHEHLDVLQLLGIGQLLVVISKIDRVAPQQLTLVRQQIESLLAHRPWPDVAVFAVSNTSGEGIDSLKNHLLATADTNTARTTKGYFRLSIDRVFNARGAGLVVTGTVAAGRIETGESLTLLPHGLELRVRGIRVHDQPGASASAGQRCALNVVGKLDSDAITRGDWLVQAGAGPASKRLDVCFSLLESAPFALKPLSPIKMHIGAKRVAGRIALLGTDNPGNRLQPGGSCLAQLILEADVACFSQQRFLLRDHADNIILGGGHIIDPRGHAAGKSRPQRIEYLKAMNADSPAAALAELAAQHRLLNLDHFRQAWNVCVDEEIGLPLEDTRSFAAQGRNWLISTTAWQRADTALLASLDSWHREQAQLRGIKATDLQALLAKHCEPALLMAVLSARLQSGELTLSQGRISRAGFQPEVSAEIANRWQAIEQLLERGGRQIPLLSEMTRETGIDAKTLEQTLKHFVKAGRLHRLNDRRYALPKHLHALAQDVIETTNDGEAITVIALKSRFGTGRNLTIEILEYFDSIRFTRRKDDSRVVLDTDLPARLFSG